MVAIPLLFAMVTDPAVGVSEALAAERASRIGGIRYELDLVVPQSVTAPIEGTAHIRFSLRDAKSPVVLDFAPGAERVHSVTIRGKAAEWRAANGHLILPPDADDITISFAAGDGPLNRNPEYFYALFVPARAHHAIPCFDQPDLKTRFTVRMKLPEGWVGITNAGDGVETKPLSTYLFSFAAGKFLIETAERGGRTMHLYHRETDAKKVARNRDAIFDLHAAAIRWMEEYTGIPYPFGKFDFIAVPAFQFGGMEHAGAIDYNAASLFLEESATQAQLLGRASVISHETAHMWFGDLVTMKWFNDVWMKEVFANFMAAKIVNPSFPELNHDLRFFLAHYRTAYSVDRTGGANAIRQRLENLNEAGTLYGPIIYQKAPIVMRMLERTTGEAKFRDGLRNYLKTYAFGNATWPDLIAILGKQAGTDLSAWSKAWVDTPGRPVVETELSVRDGRIASLSFRQRTGHPQSLVVCVDGRDYQNASETVGLPAPNYVLPRGYGEFVLDPASQAYLLAHLPELADPLLRAEAWSALWENMLGGRVSEAELMSLALSAIPRESEELNLQRLLNDVERLAWRSPESSARLEQILRAGMADARNRSIRAAYFQALRTVAQTPATVAWLAQVWRKEVSIPDLPLGENDYIRLAADLTLRGIDVRADELARIQNADRKAQWAFVSPALDPDPGVRTRFFESLADRKNRAREAWVLEALGYLHHPSRTPQSIAYIQPSLDLLREIQRTGDIFFPQRWIGVTLANHRSKKAAATVGAFLESLPADYPARLRLNILAAADDLFRSR